jgi:hypothetical protein
MQMGIVALLALVVCNSSCQLNPASRMEQEGPRAPKTGLRITPQSVQFDPVSRRDSVRVVFQVENTGVQPLYLYKAGTNTPQAVVQLPDTTTGPGATTSLTCILPPTAQAGEQFVSVSVFANTQQKVHSLKIFGQRTD